MAKNMWNINFFCCGLGMWNCWNMYFCFMSFWHANLALEHLSRTFVSASNSIQKLVGDLSLYPVLIPNNSMVPSSGEPGFPINKFICLTNFSYWFCIFLYLFVLYLEWRRHLRHISLHSLSYRTINLRTTAAVYALLTTGYTDHAAHLGQTVLTIAMQRP